jgi:hypothetical protein
MYTFKVVNLFLKHHLSLVWNSHHKDQLKSFIYQNVATCVHILTQRHTYFVETSISAMAHSHCSNK